MPQLPFFKVGDFGQTIRRTIVDEKNDAVDISAANLMEFHFKDPSGNVDTKNNALHGVAHTDGGTDGQVEYVVQSGLFDEEGTWTLQVQITDDLVYVIYTEQEEFTVSPVLA